MGCACPSRTAKAYETSLKGIKQSEEVDKLADLPVIAKDEELDLVTLVEISIKCVDLPSPDRFNAIDPVAYLLLEAEGSFAFSDHTEVQYNTVSPAFITSFNISYSFEKPLRFKVDIYDNKQITMNPPNRNALIGTTVLNIHEIVCSPLHTVEKTLLNPISKRKFNGNIHVHSEEIGTSYNEVAMVWTLIGNYRETFVLRLSRSSDNEFIPIFQSESQKFDGKGSVHWNQISVSVNKICKGDKNNQIFAEVFRVSNGLKSFGNCSFSLNVLRSAAVELTLNTLENEKICLKLLEFEYLEKHTFLEYVLGGCEISMIIGMDFTKSNGNPDLETSLHHLNSETPNEYISAILEVGRTLQYYDSDKKIPAYGFGAKLPPKFEVVSHCFALNRNFFNPDNNGIDEVIDQYKSIVKNVQLHGPTFFSEIIKTTSQYASSTQVSQSHQQYFILLILTDGIINDLEKTIDEIAFASRLPISIIIVGVGSEDFSMMKILDADDQRLFSKKYNMEVVRDIIQFVPYRDFKGKAHALAREVLFEIPKQMMDFMDSKKIVPNKADIKNESQALLFKQVTIHDGPSSSNFLKELQGQFIEEIIEHGCNRKDAEDIVQDGVYCMDPAHALEMVVEKRAKNRSTTMPKSILKGKLSKSKTLTIKENQNSFCYVCQANAINIVLKDCGCEVVCSRCVKSIGHTCPSCKSPIVKYQTKF